jgi:D-inositol-3-phosphate glycosyltransferase
LVQTGADVVHAHGSKAALVCATAAVVSRRRLIWLKVDGSLDGLVARAIARCCDRVVGISDFTVRSLGPGLQDRIKVVYPGVPKYAVNRDVGRQLVGRAIGLPPDGEVLVVSGRICPPKGQQEIVEIAPRLLERRPNLHFTFLGGEYSAYRGHQRDLRRRCAELGVSDRVVFAGFRSDLVGSVEDAVAFVSGCDLLAAPSMREAGRGWQEGFGLSVAEALQVGTPVVAYANGSLPEVIGNCGMVVDEGDRAGLAEAILRMLEDRTERERRIACGRRRVEQMFRRQNAFVGMKRVYSAVAAT